MRAFRDRPIRQKLLLTTLASSVAALLLATGGFLLWEVGQFRAEIERDTTAQSRIVADSSAVALIFKDEVVVRETLDLLRLRPHIRMACLYPLEGVAFAGYGRQEGNVPCPATPPAQAGFGWRTLQIVTPVVARGERVGTLYVERELTDMRDRLLVGALAFGSLVLLASLAAVLASSRIQHAIVAPLQQLATTARTISTTRDYSLRAAPGSGDEIGVVIQAFNEMLSLTADALQRERDANRLKDEFLATLSHELRTPLNAVLGWARVLRETQPKPEIVQRALESIERNAVVQARLIEDLLEISRIVAGKLRVDPKPVDLAAVVEAAVEVVQPAASAKQVRLTVGIAERPAMTMGDAGRLQQIVWNVVSNAVKFTPPAGSVSVRLERAAGYRIVVSDTGAGIDPRFLPRVFDAFRQADGGASREHGGLGLGLAIAKQLVELHGGTIRAESEGRDRGATFEILLPSVMAAAAPPGFPASEPSPGPDCPRDLLRGVRVLVVEDEPDARTLLETALTGYGAQITTAAPAAEAFAALDRALPDVLLSDIGMPQVDGYAFMRELRARAVGVRREHSRHRGDGVCVPQRTRRAPLGGLSGARAEALRSSGGRPARCTVRPARAGADGILNGGLDSGRAGMRLRKERFAYERVPPGKQEQASRTGPR